MPQSNIPYGNAYLVNTPKMDRLQAMMISDQRQKELSQQREQAMLDQEMSKNMSGMKDADIPELSQKWSKYKQLKQDLYRNGNKYSNDQRIQKELEAQMALGEAHQVINSSKQDLEYLKNHTAAVGKDTKGLYADDARYKIQQWMKTPTSQRDMGRDSEIFYPYQVPDLNKELTTARGVAKEVPYTLGQSATDPLKDDTEVYKVGNNPNQFYNTLLGGIVSSNKGRNFTGLIHNSYTDQDLEDLQNKYYAKVNDPKFIAIYGQPQPFPESSDKTDLGKAVKIRTMQEVVDTPLTPTKKVSVVNVDRATKGKQEFLKMMQDGRLLAQLQRSRETEAGKNARTALITQYHIDDVAGEALSNVFDIDIPMVGKQQYVDISKLSPSKQEDLIGKEDANHETVYKPYEIGQMKLLKVKEGKLLDQDDKIIDPTAVKANTFKRTGAVEKATGTGKVTVRGEKATQGESKPQFSLNASERRKK